MKKNEMKVIGEFCSEFSTYKILETEDKSKTLYSGHYDEACHSLSGAVEETLHNYVHGCEVPQRISNYECFNILEVGFGLGVGVISTINYLQENCPKTPIHFISLEIDEALIQWSKTNLQFSNKDFGLWQTIELNDHNSLRYFEGEYENVKLTILIGDARKTLPKAYDLGLIPEIHAIYQDAFSPKKNPSLWTVEWFELLKKISHEENILSTYSASSSVKKSLVKAAWIIEKAPGFGPKRASTKAKLYGEMSEEVALNLSRSPILPVYDCDI